MFNQFADLQVDKNINDDDAQAGGDNRHVRGAIKGLFADKARQNVICALLKGKKANEKMDLIAEWMRSGKYIKNRCIFNIRLLIWTGVVKTLLGD